MLHRWKRTTNSLPHLSHQQQETATMIQCRYLLAILVLGVTKTAGAFTAAPSFVSQPGRGCTHHGVKSPTPSATTALSMAASDERTYIMVRSQYRSSRRYVGRSVIVARFSVVQRITKRLRSHTPCYTVHPLPLTDQA